jgi:hypothetical protein
VSLADLGNLGEVVGGLSTFVLLVIALITAPSAWSDWRARQRAERGLAEARTREFRLDQERTLRGWMPNGVQVYGVALVTEPAQIEQAVAELTVGGPSAYVLLRVNESADGNEGRAYHHRQLVEADVYVAKAPSKAEYAALLRGRAAPAIEIPLT